jgi:shikimate kinase
MTPDDRPVFLVGFMGCGKTAAGRALAAQIGWEFADTDDLVVQREGRAIERIFRESGEGRFRELEWEALVAQRGRRRVVVATGGGLFLGVVQRKFLKEEGVTVWIDVPLPVIERRLGSEGAERPLWTSADRLSLRALFERRRAAYALADHRVPGIPGDPGAVGLRVLRRFRPLPH